MFFKESFSGLCLFAAGYAEVEAGWLQQAAIFIAASAATLYYVRGAIKKIPPDTEKYRHVNDCEKLCQANLDAHEKLEREMNERLASLSGHSAGSRKAIYESVRKLSEDVAALKATGEHQTQQLYALEAKVDKIREDISK